jgi:hypothetical protein
MDCIVDNRREKTNMAGIKKADLTGERFGRLTVIKQNGCKGPRKQWLCQCDCGGFRNVITSNLRCGHTRSCGCLWRELNKTHGKTKTPTYVLWAAMLRRCNTKSHTGYSNYGARGIKVCERWNDFSNFLADMGERPEGLSIERLDNNGPYSPENCVWASRQEQSNNTRRNRMLSHNGQTRSVAQWAAILGCSEGTIRSRLRLGWSVATALTKPIDKRYRTDLY